MHAVSVDTGLRLWHKRRIQSVTLCNRFDCHLKRHDRICHVQRLVIMKINLMLCRRILMVRRFHDKSHLLQGQDHIAARIFTQIQRPDIKIACLFMRDRRRISLIIRVEQEKFTLRTDIKPVAHLFCVGEHTFQHISRISFERSPI